MIPDRSTCRLPMQTAGGLLRLWRQHRPQTFAKIRAVQIWNIGLSSWPSSRLALRVQSNYAVNGLRVEAFRILQNYIARSGG